MGERADLGFASELDGFDPTEWAPAATPRHKEAPEERVARRELAEATGFRSREPGTGSEHSSDTAPTGTTAGSTKKPRRRRTGRNAQFNIKTRPETIEAFCAVADARGWGLGETLEHAVALLQKESGAGRSGN